MFIPSMRKSRDDKEPTNIVKGKRCNAEYKLRKKCNHSRIFIFTRADEVRNLLARSGLGETPPCLPHRECASRKGRDTVTKGEEGG